MISQLPTNAPLNHAGRRGGCTKAMARPVSPFCGCGWPKARCIQPIAASFLLIFGGARPGPASATMAAGAGQAAVGAPGGKMLPVGVVGRRVAQALARLSSATGRAGGRRRRLW
jgi:hypothetical protein